MIFNNKCAAEAMVSAKEEMSIGERRDTEAVRAFPLYLTKHLLNIKHLKK